MAKPKKVKKEIKTESKFALSLDLGPKEIYRAEADTFQEVLEILHKETFGKIKTWGVFYLAMGGKIANIKLRQIQIRRALVGKFGRELLEKRLMMRLK